MLNMPIHGNDNTAALNVQKKVQLLLSTQTSEMIEVWIMCAPEYAQ